MANKKAVVTGITGQDGAYLAQFLMEQGYEVFGTYRRSSSANFWRLDYLGINEHKNLHLVEHELTDQGSAIRLVEKVRPDEIYNLAAQSFVGVSFNQPLATLDVDGGGPVCLLEAIRQVKPDTRFYQASTSEMFGKVQSVPQNEDTAFYPRSPYGAAKLYAHWMTVNYREGYNIFACSGILFNHESPLRGMEFVTRKITDAVARIKTGRQECLSLGNMAAKRDWGYAKEYVEGMWRMMQTPEPGTYVLATGKTTTVKDFVELAFKSVDIEIEWSGEGIDEKGRCKKTGKVIVQVNPEFFRPAEVELLIGDPTKAKTELQWVAKTTLDELCAMMVKADLQRIEKGNSL